MICACHAYMNAYIHTYIHTILHTFIYTYRTELTEPLTPLVDVPDSTGLTPLHFACSDNNLELVDQLLKAGANPEAMYYSSCCICMVHAKKQDRSQLVAMDTSKLCILLYGVYPGGSFVFGDASLTMACWLSMQMFPVSIPFQDS